MVPLFRVLYKCHNEVTLHSTMKDTLSTTLIICVRPLQSPLTSSMSLRNDVGHASPVLPHPKLLRSPEPNFGHWHVYELHPLRTPCQEQCALLHEEPRWYRWVLFLIGGWASSRTLPFVPRKARKQHRVNTTDVQRSWVDLQRMANRS